jgi:cellulose synthase/poly-beta-1,6-N-acetylglucosamine synthase-like glycosyltransferase
MISVAIPEFNADRALTACVCSVLAQTVPADQIIEVDDGSTDGTAKVAKSFGAQVILIRQENKGSAVARQAGTELSLVEYVASVDADDCCPESHLGEVAEICSSENVRFLLSDLVRARPGSAPSETLPRNTTFRA